MLTASTCLSGSSYPHRGIHNHPLKGRRTRWSGHVAAVLPNRCSLTVRLAYPTRRGSSRTCLSLNRSEFDAGFVVEASPAGTPGVG